MSQNPETEPRPAIHHRYRDDGWTPEVQRKFFHTLAACGSVVEACRVANRSASSAYRLRANPAAHAFRDAWAAGKEMAYRQVFDLAMDRVVLGVEQPVYHRGEQIGFKTTYSDRLICHLLDHLRPVQKAVEVTPHRDRHDYDLAVALSEIEPDPVLDTVSPEQAAEAYEAEEIALMDWRDEVDGPPVAEPLGPTEAEWKAMTDDQRQEYYRTGNYSVPAPATPPADARPADAEAGGGDQFLRTGLNLV